MDPTLPSAPSHDSAASTDQSRFATPGDQGSLDRSLADWQRDIELLTHGLARDYSYSGDAP